MKAPQAPPCTDPRCVELENEVQAVGKQLRRAEDDAMRRRKNEDEHRRRVEAGLRRTFEEDRALRGDLWVSSYVNRVTQPVTELLHRVATLSQRPRAVDLEALQEARSRTEVLIRTYTADLEPLSEVYRRSRAEVLRIREYVMARGRALHAESVAGQDLVVGCTCAGCELIVGLDDLGEPATEASA